MQINLFYKRILFSSYLFIPIVVSSIQSSVKTAIAMEVRGYGAPYKKTRLYESYITIKDLLYIIFNIIFLIFIILIRFKF